MNANPIGMFDSGVGGLSIFNFIKNYLPNENIVYFADSINVPYGRKKNSEIRELSESIVDYLIKEYNVKMVVVACNTATVSAISYLREIFDIPFVGVVPVVKVASQITKTNKVAVLATEITINSHSHKELIHKFSNGVDIINVGCNHLVELVERLELKTEDTIETLKDCINPLLKENIDVIALGCTHYSFLKDTIISIVPSNIQILDPNEAVTNQVVRILQKHNLFNLNNKQPEYTFKTSGDQNIFRDAVKVLTGVDNYIMS